MLEDEWIFRIKSYMTDSRFEHTQGVAAVAVSLSKYYDVDEALAWKTAMLHDIARDFSRDEMLAIAKKYGYEIQDISLLYEGNMHAEIGALIAEHEFGLTDPDALNAIRSHVCACPDMSILEKIIFLSDHAEPGRPNQPMMRALLEIAKTDIDNSQQVQAIGLALGITLTTHGIKRLSSHPLSLSILLKTIQAIGLIR